MGYTVAGIDEAGRGSLFGPLVIAGISVSRERINILKELNVRDSKLLTPRRREMLYPEILKISERVFSVLIHPREIDSMLSSGKKSLNQLEAECMARIADALEASVVFVDAADTDECRFGETVKKNMSLKGRVISRHHMDERNVVVSAASIVAKVERDLAISKLKQSLGDFGSGYPSDPRTRAYLLQTEGKEYINSIRLSWKTVRKLKPVLLNK